MRTLRTDDDGFSTAEESWKFEGENGDLVELELQFARRATTRTKLEAKVYSAVKPEFYRLYRIEAAVHVVRSADRGTDRLQKYIFKGSGFAHFLTDRSSWSASHLFLGFRDRPFFRPRRIEP